MDTERRARRRVERLALGLDDADVSMRLVRGHSLLRLGAATRSAAQLEEALLTFGDLADDEPADDRAALSLASARLARSLLLQDEIDALRERLRSEFLPADGRGVEERRLQRMVERPEHAHELEHLVQRRVGHGFAVCREEVKGVNGWRSNQVPKGV